MLPQEISQMREKKKKKNLTFYQNIKLLAIVCKDLGNQAHLASKELKRSNSPQSK